MMHYAAFSFRPALLISCLAFSLCVSSARADDAEIAKELGEKGAKITLAQGVATSCNVADCTNWTEADFRKLGLLTHLRMLDFAKGLTDQQLALLGGLTEVDYLQTNLIQITDDGVKYFKPWTKLRTLKFFHPAKSFTGVGLAQLADMPSLQSLTVAGSLSFADDGMAAVAKLKQLHEFRSWHSGQTQAGVAMLKDLPALKTINLGQRLAYKPPATVSDETVGVLIEIKSLEAIQLSEARMTLAALSQLKQLPHLKTLTLDGIDIPDADVEHLRGELPKVQIKWTKPADNYVKRINAIFAGK